MQRRTFERRVQHWRATAGAARTVMFSQVHHAGDLAASDFTSMNSLGVTILGKRFEHLVYHFVLTYSNWESVTICASESFEALSDGLQNALWELGGAPRRHRSDSLSAAVNNLSAKREFQGRYRGLLEHYGLAGERINVRQPHENGDNESSHGHFKTAVDQALHLRGSRDFGSRDQYLRFLQEVVATRNAARQQRHAEELAVLRPLPAQRLDRCLRILHHAARDSESAVDDALRCLLAQDQPLSADAVIALARTSTQLPAPTDVSVEAPDLRSFDCLLEHKEVYHVEASYAQTGAV